MKKLIQVQVGSEVNLDCKPRASPRALSSWKKGEVILQENERYSVTHKCGDLPDSCFPLKAEVAFNMKWNAVAFQ